MKTAAEFEAVYRQNWEKLYAFSFNVSRDENLAQNVVQDIFVNLWERRDNIEIDAIENYLFRAAKNQIYKAYRDHKFETEFLEEKFAAHIIEQEQEAENSKEEIEPLLEVLPERRKEILYMNKVQGMDLDQIAAELNISKQTVKNQLTTAMRQLKVVYKGVGILAVFAKICLVTFS